MTPNELSGQPGYLPTNTYILTGMPGVKAYGSRPREREDAVEHPSHYLAYGIEVIELTEHMNFCRGNAVKYLARAGLKDPNKELEDLRKALWYVQREIARLQKQKERQSS